MTRLEFEGVNTRSALLGLSVTAAWCALWRDVSLANLLGGACVAALVGATGGLRGAGGPVRWRPLGRLAVIVLWDLVISTIGVAREILRPAGAEEAICAIELPTEARRHLLMLVVAITVTPGTAVVDADPATGTLYVHLLDASRLPATRDHVERLAELSIAALPARPRVSDETPPRRSSTDAGA